MVIAVNTDYFLKAYQQDYLKFIYGCFNRIAKQQPQHTFIFIANTPFDISFNFSNNSALIVVPGFKAISGILYKIKLACILKQYKADVLLNSDGFFTLFTKIPQCAIVYYPHCLSNKDFIKKNHLFVYKKFMFRFLKQAKVIVTESQVSKKYISQHYKTGFQKIDVIYNSISDSFAVIEWQEKEKIKAEYAGGNEYFVFKGDTLSQNILLNLLKAFSHFKKWQKSSMQLLILNKNNLDNGFIESLKLFKYRKEIKLLNNLPGDELEKVISGSYCMIYFPLCENFEIIPLMAMGYSIPVITSSTEAMQEIFNDAALYCNYNDYSDIAERLISIFKDEKLRQHLIERGREEIQKYNLEKVSDMLWCSLLKAGS
ncbi:MAG: glycosyltransferase [Ginsengibacter sp.]